MSDFHTSLDAALHHDPRWLPCSDCDEQGAQEGHVNTDTPIFEQLWLETVIRDLFGDLRDEWGGDQ